LQGFAPSLRLRGGADAAAPGGKDEGESSSPLSLLSPTFRCQDCPYKGRLQRYVFFTRSVPSKNLPKADLGGALLPRECNRARYHALAHMASPRCTCGTLRKKRSIRLEWSGGRFPIQCGCGIWGVPIRPYVWGRPDAPHPPLPIPFFFPTISPAEDCRIKLQGQQREREQELEDSPAFLPA